MIDDDELMGVLRQTADELDPPPDLVVTSARAALSTRLLDDELAALLMDSAVDAELVRSDDTDVRLLSFGTSAVSVELHLEPVADRLSLRGLVSGASGTILIEQPGVAHTLLIDPEGWFTTPNLHRGATRLRLNAPDGHPITTTWVVL
jgi:hypothetical protein